MRWSSGRTTRSFLPECTFAFLLFARPSLTGTPLDHRASGELPTSKRRRQDDESEQPAKKARGEDTPFKPNGVAAMNVAPLAQPSLSGIMEEDEEE